MRPIHRAPAIEQSQRISRIPLGNPNAKLELIDVQPYGSTQMHERADVLNVGGFSDSVFEVVSLFAKGELGADHWLGAINGVSLA